MTAFRPRLTVSVATSDKPPVLNYHKPSRRPAAFWIALGLGAALAAFAVAFFLATEFGRQLPNQK